MKTTVNLPDALYQKSEQLAAARGATMEQFIVEAVKKEVPGSVGSGAAGAYGDREVQLPVMRSTRPGRWSFHISTLMTYLPDVNVWIAVAAERHTLHRTAPHFCGC